MSELQQFKDMLTKAGIPFREYEEVSFGRAENCEKVIEIEVDANKVRGGSPDRFSWFVFNPDGSLNRIGLYG